MHLFQFMRSFCLWVCLLCGPIYQCLLCSQLALIPSLYCRNISLNFSKTCFGTATSIYRLLHYTQDYLQNFPICKTRCYTTGLSWTYLDFIGRQLQTFPVICHPKIYWIKLTFVEICHWRVAGLNVNGFGGFQCVFKVTAEFIHNLNNAFGMFDKYLKKLRLWLKDNQL